MRAKRVKKGKFSTVKLVPEQRAVLDRVQRAVIRNGWGSFEIECLDVPTKAVVIVEALLQMERRFKKY